MSFPSIVSFLRSRTTLTIPRGALVAGVALAAPVAAHAQSSPVSANLPVTATVLVPLSLTITHGLDFGKLLPGGNKTVTPAGVDAGRAEISGSGGSAVTLALIMPTALTLSGGGATLPVSAWTYATAASVALDTAAAASFTAGAEKDIALTMPGSGTTRLYVGIGATAQPAANQTAGSYSATGKLTVLYTDL